MTAPLHLVACVATKLGHAAPAADLYQSDWFCKARAYVEALGAPWCILSARHGIVDPETVLDPYDETLVGAPEWRRLQWGDAVVQQLWKIAPHGSKIVLLAGAMYRNAIRQQPGAGGSRWHFITPLEGLGIGQQKAWLIDRTRHGSEVPS